MTPKLKAKELIEKFYPHAQYWDCYNDCPLEYNHANKICHLVIEELIKVTHSDSRANSPLDKEYWIKVKKELNKL